MSDTAELTLEGIVTTMARMRQEGHLKLSAVYLPRHQYEDLAVWMKAQGYPVPDDREAGMNVLGYEVKPWEEGQG